MQPLKNDMDNLMRNAAADYPVLPHGADWQKVAQELKASGTSAKAAWYGVLKRLFFIFPFILTSFVCDRFFTYEYGSIKKMATSKSVNGNRDHSRHPVATNRSKTAEVTQPDFKKEKDKAEKTVPGTTGNGSLKNKTDEITRSLSHDMAVLKSAAGSEWYATAKPYASSAFLKPEMIRVLRPPIVQKLQRIIIKNEAWIKKNSTMNNRKKKQDEPIEKAYISILAGPDVSRVKAQKTEKAGYSVGVLAGYNFTKNWAVEGGLFWNKKNYFSEGEYFKTDKMYLPQHTTIVQVNGYCAMFEIPLNIRYNVLRKKGSILFASAGVSSYLMHKEDYDYVYRRYSMDYAASKLYKGASKDWLSIGNVSLGYEQRLGLKTKIRIEPYIKIPVKGVGIGSLPLNSAGMLIGITHRIHQ